MGGRNRLEGSAKGVTKGGKGLPSAKRVTVNTGNGLTKPAGVKQDDIAQLSHSQQLSTGLCGSEGMWLSPWLMPSAAIIAVISSGIVQVAALSCWD